MKKYELTNERIIFNNTTLYKIRALIAFNDVKAGQLGGWIQSEANLSHYGNCWVYDNAKVYGSACVSDNASILGHAQVYDYARISGDASIMDSAIVAGNTYVSDHARVFGEAKILDNTRLSGKISVYGHTSIRGNMTIDDDGIYGLNIKEFYNDKNCVISDIEVPVGHLQDTTTNSLSFKIDNRFRFFINEKFEDTNISFYAIPFAVNNTIGIFDTDTIKFLLTNKYGEAFTEKFLDHLSRENRQFDQFVILNGITEECSGFKDANNQDIYVGDILIQKDDSTSTEYIVNKKHDEARLVLYIKNCASLYTPLWEEKTYQYKIVGRIREENERKQ